MRRKLRLCLIANESKRRATFMRRKRGIMKKLHELKTLCGVQACGVICCPYLSEKPEVWPSNEGIQEVASRFMAMPVDARTKYMRDQETYLQEKISKVEDQVACLASENQELQTRQFMFDCLEGKMSEHRYGAKELQDLHSYINQYIAKLTRRIEILAENGESSSSFPPLLPVGVADAGTVSAASGLYDHIQHQNTNVNQSQLETIQHHVPINSYDTTQSQNMDMNQSHQGMNLDQYLSQQQSFMGLMLEQQMDYAGGDASTPFMDGNHCNYNQRPIVNLAVTTSRMPSNTTDAYVPYINNNL